jgi:hypothetical protein
MLSSNPSMNSVWRSSKSTKYLLGVPDGSTHLGSTFPTLEVNVDIPLDSFFLDQVPDDNRIVRIKGSVNSTMVGH